VMCCFMVRADSDFCVGAGFFVAAVFASAVMVAECDWWWGVMLTDASIHDLSVA